MTEPSKFCIMTTGRSGSTALTEALQSDEVLLPRDLFDCPDSELLHPRRIRDHVRWFSRELQREIATSSALIDAFYSWPTAAKFVGFKSMPNRHRDFSEFTGRKDVQFITLIREDVPSTVASFRLATLRRGQWKRQGEAQSQSWTFTEKDMPPIFGNLVYILMSQHFLRTIPDAINLRYEEICTPDFRDEALDEYFGRQIRLTNPRSPVSGSTYVSNWDVFSRFIEQTSEQIKAAISQNSGNDPSVGLNFRLNANRPLENSAAVGADLVIRVTVQQASA
jgi:hypothetical protein